MSAGRLYGGGSRAQTATSLFCREGSFPRRQQSSVLVVGRAGGVGWGRGGGERVRVRESPAQARGAAAPGGAQSIRRPGAREGAVRCAAFCAKESLLPTPAGPLRPPTARRRLGGPLFPPCFTRSHACRRANTDVDTIN